MTDRDTDQSKVYAAERMWRDLLERPGTSTDINGIPVCLEAEQRFAGIEGIRAYVLRVLSHPLVIDEYGRVRPLKVRERRGSRKAHYEPDTATIAIHTGEDSWQLREAVILHEIAHHLDPDARYGHACHGPGFQEALIDLSTMIIGPQSGLALRLCYVASGIDAAA